MTQKLEFGKIYKNPGQFTTTYRVVGFYNTHKTEQVLFIGKDEQGHEWSGSNDRASLEGFWEEVKPSLTKYVAVCYPKGYPNNAFISNETYHIKELDNPFYDVLEWLEVTYQPK